MDILVVEDDLKVARVLQRSLAEEGFTVDTCATCHEALLRAGSHPYDLLVLDWMLPDGDGLGVCRALRGRGSTVPILMLTARGEVADRVGGLEAGADDYLVKPFVLAELVARIRALLRRTAGAAGVLRVGALRIDRVAQGVTVDGRPLELRGREYALLLLLAARGGEAVSRAEILREVWGMTRDPGSNVLEVHVRRLRENLGPFAWMVATVRGVGYRLLAERPAARPDGGGPAA
ncbi:MAG TPA: response regulator transcription factor [Polyangiaceae bacterium]|nr:response regulator transcription factor [Polyangiaceae bacterium]